MRKESDLSEQNAADITIRINERSERLPKGVSLSDVRRAFKPDADVTILNGFPLTTDCPISDGDEVVLIEKGKTPSHDELEALLVARHGPGVHQRVKSAKVGIAGCGGLGSSLAISLARTGIGFLVLVDFDVVEPSNLNRQQYFVDQIGQPKVDAMRENIRRINPYVQLECHHERLTRENIPTIFAGCSVIAECFDDPKAKRDILSSVAKFMPSVPLVAVSGIAGYGCANEIRSRRIFGNAFLIGDNESAAQQGRGLLAPRVSVAAGHQANVILRLLLGEIRSEDEG